MMSINKKLENFRNEEIELTTFFCRRANYMYPTHAGFDLYGESGNVEIFTEDLKTMEKAGYSITQSAGEIETPIIVILAKDKDRIDCVVGPNGTFKVNRRQFEIVDVSAPADGDIGTENRIAYAPFDKPQTQTKNEEPPSGHGLSNLFIKVANVMAEVKRVEKTKAVTNNSGAKMYDIATGDDLLDMLRPIMAKHNLVCIPNMDEIEKTSKTEKITQYHGYFTFILADGDSGQMMKCKWESEVDDWSDRAINKVSRTATRYFLTNLFQLTTGDEKDDADLSAIEDAPENRRAQPASQQTRQRQQVKKGDTKDDAPAEIISKIMNDKSVQAVWSSPQEARNTINKMWRDKELTTDTDEADLILSVIERLQSHSKEAEAQS